MLFSFSKKKKKRCFELNNTFKLFMEIERIILKTILIFMEIKRIILKTIFNIRS